MPCKDINDRLGEYVTGALESDEAEAIRDHLDSCAACAAELKEIKALELTLSSLGATPVKRLHLFPLLAAASILIVAVISVWSLMHPPSAELLEGTLLTVSARHDAPMRLAHGTSYVASEESILRLPCGAELRLARDCELEFKEAHELDVKRGAMSAQIPSGSPTLTFSTPSGTITTAEAHFGLAIEERDMSKGSTTAISGAIITVAVITGFVIFDQRGDEKPVPVNGGEQFTTSGDNVKAEPLDLLAESSAARKDIDLLQAQVTELRGKNAQLVTSAAKLEEKSAHLLEENAKLRSQVAASADKKAATVAEMMTLFSKLKTKGISALLNPGATSKLAYDVRRLGDEGVDAMLEFMKSPDENDRFLATKILEELQSPRAYEQMKEAALHDESKRVASMNSRALMLQDSRDVIPYLREIAEKGELGPRVNAAFGLVKHADQKGIEITMGFLKGENEFLKSKIAEGVLLLNGDHVIPLINQIQSMSDHREGIMLATVSWYARQKTTAARTQLQDIARNESFTAAVRESALQALSQ